MKTVIFLTFVAAASAHLCMISPPQRGSMVGINTAGAKDCILLPSQCGGRPMMTPGISIKAMQNFTVTFQKNLDHWVKANPGYFSVSVADATTMQFTELEHIIDMGEPSLHLYSINITISMAMQNKAVIIQSQYVTKNPMAPPIFYQCADVMVN